MSAEFPVYARSGLNIVAGKGSRVWDDQGREFVDFYGGHAVATLGYGDTILSRAIQAQVGKLIFQTNAVELEVRRQACADIASISPVGLDRVLLLNSGAEANENALRFAFQLTRRSRAVALYGAFHGRSAAASAVTDHSAAWCGFPRTPFEVDWVNPGDLDSLDETLTDEVAAFIFEPVQGVAGAVKVDEKFLLGARKLCTDRGVVMICDEVQSGMGRSGHMFACQGFGLVPDLLTTAKGLGGGFPVGALIAPSSWTSGLKVGSFGTTFGGGPVASVAISTVITALKEPGFLAQVARLSNRLKSELVGGSVHAVSGEGYLLGVHMDRPASVVRPYLMEQGFLTGDAKNPCVVRLLPPLIIDDADVDGLIRAFRQMPS